MLAIYLQLIDTTEAKSEFEILYYEYRKLMYYIAFDIVGDRHLAEDVVSETFKHSVITSFVVSVLLEVVEVLETYFGLADFPAVVDVNDAVMNVMGGIVGYVIIKNYQSGRMKL